VLKIENNINKHYYEGVKGSTMGMYCNFEDLDGSKKSEKAQNYRWVDVPLRSIVGDIEASDKIATMLNANLVKKDLLPFFLRERSFIPDTLIMSLEHLCKKRFILRPGNAGDYFQRGLAEFNMAEELDDFNQMGFLENAVNDFRKARKDGAINCDNVYYVALEKLDKLKNKYSKNDVRRHFFQQEAQYELNGENNYRRN
jgi:hypothetical protein